MKRIGMAKLSRWALTGMLVFCCGIRAADNQEVALRTAIQKEVVDGDLPSAIRIYKAIAESGNPAVAAQALLRMGRCLERLGNPEARLAYQRVVTQFASQKEAAQEAHDRLAALAKTGGQPRETVGWYNGDWQSGIPGPANWYRQDREFSRIYDDFVVPEGGWTVVGVFSNNHMDFTGVTMAAWAIRRDSSPQSGGTVVASDVSPATQTPIAGNELLPRDSVVGYRIQVSGLHVRLAPGRYWLNVAPVGSGKSFVSSTRGKNAVGNPPGNNGLALLDSPARGLLFELAEMVGKSGQFGIGKDFSQGVLIVDNVNSK